MSSRPVLSAHGHGCRRFVSALQLMRIFLCGCVLVLTTMSTARVCQLQIGGAHAAESSGVDTTASATTITMPNDHQTIPNLSNNNNDNGNNNVVSAVTGTLVITLAPASIPYANLVLNAPTNEDARNAGAGAARDGLAASIARAIGATSANAVRLADRTGLARPTSGWAITIAKAALGIPQTQQEGQTQQLWEVPIYVTAWFTDLNSAEAAKAAMDEGAVRLALMAYPPFAFSLATARSHSFRGTALDVAKLQTEPMAKSAMSSQPLPVLLLANTTTTVLSHTKAAETSKSVSTAATLGALATCDPLAPKFPKCIGPCIMPIAASSSSSTSHALDDIFVSNYYGLPTLTEQRANMTLTAEALPGGPSALACPSMEAGCCDTRRRCPPARSYGAAAAWSLVSEGQHAVCVSFSNSSNATHEVLTLMPYECAHHFGSELGVPSRTDEDLALVIAAEDASFAIADYDAAGTWRAMWRSRCMADVNPTCPERLAHEACENGDLPEQVAASMRQVASEALVVMSTPRHNNETSWKIPHHVSEMSAYPYDIVAAEQEQRAQIRMAHNLNAPEQNALAAALSSSVSSSAVSSNIRQTKDLSVTVEQVDDDDDNNNNNNVTMLWAPIPDFQDFAVIVGETTAAAMEEIRRENATFDIMSGGTTAVALAEIEREGGHLMYNVTEAEARLVAAVEDTRFYDAQVEYRSLMPHLASTTDVQRVNAMVNAAADGYPLSTALSEGQYSSLVDFAAPDAELMEVELLNFQEHDPILVHMTSGISSVGAEMTTTTTMTEDITGDRAQTIQTNATFQSIIVAVGSIAVMLVLAAAAIFAVYRRRRHRRQRIAGELPTSAERSPAVQRALMAAEKLGAHSKNTCDHDDDLSWKAYVKSALAARTAPTHRPAAISEATSHFNSARLLPVVSNGRYGRLPAYKGTLRDKTAVHVLIVEEEKRFPGLFEAHAGWWCRLRHAHLARWYGVCLDVPAAALRSSSSTSRHGAAAAIIEACENGSLRSRIRDSPALGFRARVRALTGVAKALSEIHSCARAMGRVGPPCLHSSLAKLAHGVHGRVRSDCIVFGAGDVVKLVPPVDPPGGAVELPDAAAYRRQAGGSNNSGSAMEAAEADDLFALGVVMVEAITGLPAVERAGGQRRRLADHWLAQGGRFGERPPLVDPRVQRETPAVAEMALICLGDVALRCLQGGVAAFEVAGELTKLL